MRPLILAPLFAEVDSLQGVGPGTRRLLSRLSGARVIDLLLHLPQAEVERRAITALSESDLGQVVSLDLRVMQHQPPLRRGLPYRLACMASNAPLSLVYFHRQPKWLEALAPQGAELRVSGKLERYQDRWQMVHPDYLLPLARAEEIPARELIYPLTEGLTNRTLLRSLDAALNLLPALPEWHSQDLLDHYHWPDWKTAMRELHQPQSPLTPEERSPALTRLAYDELLAGQLTLALMRRQEQRKLAQPLAGSGEWVARLLAALPFTPTDAQQRVIAEILEDLQGSKPMMRLLQGDVGSGKTLVATAAMLRVAEAGQQAVLMAPTELLARQHQQSLESLLKPLGITPLLVTGRDSARARQSALKQLAEGEAKIVVGTHAVFQEAIQFHSLALAVVDEQHRFGVQQRLRLSQKGGGTHVLLMTATPIPRSLLMTAYGDLDNAILNEKPAGRQPIRTLVKPLSELDAVIAALERQLAKGARSYWICPRVEESDDSQLMAATARAASLEARFPGQVTLLHGQMSSDAKDAAMTAFARGERPLLVATTVVEVGVDVPEATLLLIENAEHFGLAQLHQLRGRIGRGKAASTCILLYESPLGEVARQRLELMRRSEDGFLIAEEDLRLRGGGDLLGTRQSGIPAHRIAALGRDADLLRMAHQDAQRILDGDPGLSSARGERLRTLLYLFKQDLAVKYFRTG